MPRACTGRPNGRPKKPITLAQVEKLFALGCTQPEVAAFLGVGLNTLTTREGFREAQEHGIATGKQSLRRAQMKSALSGNSRMLTWMGMQLLKQRNQTSTEVSGPDGGPVQTEDLSRLSDADLAHLESIHVKLAPQLAGYPPGEVPETPDRVH